MPLSDYFATLKGTVWLAAALAVSFAIVLLLVALIVNNLSKNRTYPEYWW